MLEFHAFAWHRLLISSRVECPSETVGGQVSPTSGHEGDRVGIARLHSACGHCGLLPLRLGNAVCGTEKLGLFGEWQLRAVCTGTGLAARSPDSVRRRALPGTGSSLRTDPLFESLVIRPAALVSSKPPSDGMRVESYACTDAE